MGLLKVVLTVASVLVTLGANADVGVRVFGTPTQSNQHISKKANRQSPVICSDFSGVYEGKCDDETVIRELLIYQKGCDFISVDGIEFNIGAVESRGLSNAGYTSNTSQNLQWDDHGKALQLTYLGHHQYNDTSSSFPSITIPLAIVSQVFLVGNQLNVNSKMWNEQVNCSYTK